MNPHPGPYTPRGKNDYAIESMNAFYFDLDVPKLRLNWILHYIPVVYFYPILGPKAAQNWVKIWFYSQKMVKFGTFLGKKVTKRVFLPSLGSISEKATFSYFFRSRTRFWESPDFKIKFGFWLEKCWKIRIKSKILWQKVSVRITGIRTHDLSIMRHAHSPEGNSATVYSCN